MIEIEYKEKEKVDNLYNQIKNIILSKKDNKSFNYNYKQHSLYEELEYPGISKNYYNESGEVEFENINGNTIRIEISRWHVHKHNGYSGLNGIPCLSATIYIVEKAEKHVVWELNVRSGTLYYKAKISSLEIPNDILQEKHIYLGASIKKNKAISMPEDKIEKESQIIKSQETRILFDEIVNLYNKYKFAEQTKEKLLLKRQQEIEETTEKIIKYYSPKLLKNNEDIIAIKKELNDFNKLFTKYSTFNIDLIGQAIQQLMTLVESEEYLYKQVTYVVKKRVHGVMDSWDEDMQIKASIVLRKEKLINYYNSSYEDESKINVLIKNEDALLLFEQDINNYNKKITFYTLQDGKVLDNINFGKFDYIKEFIDNIVQYRFQNNMTDFSKKDMLSFMKNFLIKHKDIIMKNYDSKIKEKVLSLKLDIS